MFTFWKHTTDLPVTPHIKTPRQRRLLRLLATGKKYGVKDIQNLVGVAHGPALVRELRNNGWEITRERFKVVDRDGRNVYPSRYYLEDVKQARELLK